MQDRQHRAVALRVEELDPLPGALERRGLRLAITDDGERHEIRVVEHGAEGMRQHVAELAALVDRSRRGRSDVARDPAGSRELTEQPRHPRDVFRDLRIDLGVRALEVDVGEHRGSTVTGPREIDDVEIVRADQPVDVGVEQAQARRGAPVSEQARLDVCRAQRLAE